jgi:hypothetical protein
VGHKSQKGIVEAIPSRSAQIPVCKQRLTQMGEIYVMTEPWLVVSQVTRLILGSLDGCQVNTEVKIEVKMVVGRSVGRDSNICKWICLALSPSAVGKDATETSAYSRALAN